MVVSDARGMGALLKKVAAMGFLVARIRDCARAAEQFHLERELTRIADELLAVRKAVMEWTPDIPEPEPEPEPEPDYRRDTRTRAKNPSPGRRICSKCRVELPVGEFAYLKPENGFKRRADCKTCFNAGQRERYVRAGYKIVTIEVLENDICVGRPCPICGEPFEVGQLIQGDNVHHERCAR